jgi:putative thiamine transport system permease protein
VPQIGFLFGVQVILLLGRLDGTWIALVGMHLLFVLPYVFLSLREPYLALDPRYDLQGRCLGRSAAFVFVRVKLPMLLRPLLAAAAVAFAVSVGQYLPTLFAGAGRLTTLTTEAVALASGADRRIGAVYACVQALLPMAGFTLALLVPRFLYRDRRGMVVT